MEKNNNMYGQDRKKEEMQHKSADDCKNQGRQGADPIGSQSDKMKSGVCDKSYQNSASQGGSDWKKPENGTKQDGRTDGQGDKYGVNKDGQQSGSQSGQSVYGSQTTKTAPGMNGTGNQSGISDKDKTDGQKKTTPGGSY